MNLNSFRSLFLKSSAVLASTVVVALTGCGIGPLQTANSTDTVAAPFRGVLHGGVNPVIGARVVIYATTSTGYGAGQFLQEATQVGASAHQDTDSNGSFNFLGGFTCPAGQYAYVVAYGGNTGGNTNNPNSVLVTALGACSTLYSGTTYQGSSVWVDEATTIAAAYALSNFISVTGDAINGYTVGIGAPATNNASSGCVANAYYSGCSTTTAAGLGHAFTNATGLVNTNTGNVNSTMNNGAIIPVIEINTLANALQACVNSNGGGTNGSGLPSTTTTSTGTSHDGTACGRLFAFTSYTNTGAFSGTLTAAGNTLDAAKNLAKRPTGSASTFDSNCSSNSGTGTNTAVNCIFLQAPGNGFFNPAMSAAPPEWTIGISYAKASFSNSTTNVFTTGASCQTTQTNNGLFYPSAVETDINDNVVIFNADGNAPKCDNLIAISSTGANLGVSSIFTGTSGAVSIGLDAWGHALLPLKTGNGVVFYQYAAGGTADAQDSSIPAVLTVTSPGSNTSPFDSQYVASDNNSRIYIGASNSINTFGYLAPATLSHTAPTYTATNFTNTTTSALIGTFVDFNNNAFAVKTTSAVGATPTSTSFATSGTTGLTSPSGLGGIVADTSGNAWEVTANGTTLGTSQTIVMKYPYTASGATLTWGTAPTGSSPTYAYPITSNAAYEDGLNTKVPNIAMDGSNVIWFGENFPGTAAGTGGFLRSYDTVNGYAMTQLLGCKFAVEGTFTVTAWNIGASSTTFTLSGTSVVAVGAVMNLSGFATSTFFNGAQATVTASSAGSITVSSTFGQAASNNTEAGVATGRPATTCGNNTGDTSFPSNTPFIVYATRGIAVDTMGNIWMANGTQGQVNEILGLAAPTWPTYIHLGAANKQP